MNYIGEAPGPQKKYRNQDLEAWTGTSTLLFLLAAPMVMICLAHSLFPLPFALDVSLMGVCPTHSLFSSGDVGDGSLSSLSLFSLFFLSWAGPSAAAAAVSARLSGGVAVCK